MMSHLEIRDERLSIDLYPSFVNQEYSESLFNHLEVTVPWRDKITPGRRVSQNYYSYSQEKNKGD